MKTTLMKARDFDALVNEAVLFLTPKGQELLAEVVLRIERRPDNLPNNQPNGFVLGQFSGSRKFEGGLYPACIVLFQEDIEFANRFNTTRGMKKHISEIIAHELAHYLGMDEAGASQHFHRLLKEYMHLVGAPPTQKPWYSRIFGGRK